MPKPSCVQCGAHESLLWRSQGSGQVCNQCYLGAAEPAAPAEPRPEEDEAPARATGKGTRKSTRATRYKPRTPAPAPPRTGAPPPARQSAPPPARAPAGAPRGRGRRSLFKRPPLKAPAATATVVSSDSIFYKGTYLQVGDVVSVRGVDGGTYYAQLRGFLTDQYCEKSAALTWLLPTKASPPPEKGFDPATYIIGPEEDLPRKLQYMQVVMRAPSDYYRTGAGSDHGPYIWTSLEPREYT